MLGAEMDRVILHVFKSGFNHTGSHILALHYKCLIKMYTGGVLFNYARWLFVLRDGSEWNFVQTSERSASVPQSQQTQLWTNPKAAGPPQASPSFVVVHFGFPARAMTVTRNPYLMSGSETCHAGHSHQWKVTYIPGYPMKHLTESPGP